MPFGEQWRTEALPTGVRHFRWGGMQVGFRELTIWSFLMASAHGAGLMALPMVLAGPHAHHHAGSQGAASGLWATLIMIHRPTKVRSSHRRYPGFGYGAVTR